MPIIWRAVPQNIEDDYADLSPSAAALFLPLRWKLGRAAIGYVHPADLMRRVSPDSTPVPECLEELECAGFIEREPGRRGGSVVWIRRGVHEPGSRARNHATALLRNVATIPACGLLDRWYSEHCKWLTRSPEWPPSNLTDSCMAQSMAHSMAEGMAHTTPHKQRTDNGDRDGDSDGDGDSDRDGKGDSPPPPASAPEADRAAESKPGWVSPSRKSRTASPSVERLAERRAARTGIALDEAIARVRAEADE